MHTPGPWTVAAVYPCEAPYFGIYMPDGNGIPCEPQGGPETEANAHLIAAAPEMLEALERFAYIEWGGTAHVGEPPEHIKQAYRIIAKAKRK